MESLEGRTLLSAIGVSLDQGNVPQVVEFDGTTLAQNKNFLAFTSGFSGGVRVAMGDVNGDGTADVIAGTGPGTAAQVKVFDGVTGNEIRSFFPFGPTYQGGVYVAAGDLNRDGASEILVGTGGGTKGEIRIFDGVSGGMLKVATPFGSSFTGGVSVAAGDVNGDGVSEIIAGSATGAGVIVVTDGVTGKTRFSLTPFGTAYTGGVSVAAGDLNGDGHDDVVAGSGAGILATVRTYDGATGNQLSSIEPFGSVLNGVRVATGDINGDGKADLIAGSGPGNAASVKVFDGTSTTVLKNFAPVSVSITTGIFVAGEVPKIKNTPPVFTVPQSPIATFTDVPTSVSDLGTVTDADPYNYNGAILQVTIGRSGRKKNDRLTLATGGASTLNGSQVLISGKVVGTVTGGTGKLPLRIVFNDQASAGDVQSVLRGVTFTAGSDPRKSVAGTRRVFFQLQDNFGVVVPYVTRDVTVA